MSDVLHGVDLSQHNGNVDFKALKDHVDFVMLRAGYGRYAVDNKFHKNASSCEELGIPFGIYWFSYACSAQEAEAEAMKCIQTTHSYHMDYPIVFDWEDDSLRVCKENGVAINGPSMPTAFANAFFKKIKEAGFTPLLYSNPAYLRQYFDFSMLDCDLWLAQWPGGTPNLNTPPTVSGVKPVMWQYTAKGRVPGIKGDVDKNVCYVDYKKKKAEQGKGKTMTVDEVYNLLMKKLNFQKQESWAKDEIAKAKELGFTDGKNPYDIPSRAEVMTMINRAISIAQKTSDK